MRFRFFTVILLLVSAGSAAQTRGATEDCAKLVDRAFDLAGYNEFINQFPAQIEAAAQRQASEGKVEPAVQEIVSAVMKRAFAPDTIRAGLRDAYLSHCDARMLQAVAVGLDTPLGRRTRKMEAYSETVEGSIAMRQFAGTLQQNPPRRERVVMAEEMDQATHSTDFLVDMVSSMARAMSSAVAGQELPAEGFSKMKSQLREPLHNTVLVSSLFTYRELDDAELRQYIELYRSAPFQQFSQIFQHGVLLVMEKQSKIAGAEIKKAAEAARKSSGS